jgi:hypothetical protein
LVSGLQIPHIIVQIEAMQIRSDQAVHPVSFPYKHTISHNHIPLPQIKPPEIQACPPSLPHSLHLIPLQRRPHPPSLRHAISGLIDQEPRPRHERRIPVHDGRRLEPWDNHPEEILNLGVCAARAQFRDPDGTSARHVARRVDVRFEVVDAGCVVVP